MTAVFHLFSKLPAELRAAVWNYALQNEQGRPSTETRRQIQFHKANLSTHSVAVNISPPYPTLFATNREARSEAAKLQCSDWVTVYASHHGSDGVSNSPEFKICVNFDRDCICLSEKFLEASQCEAWRNETDTPEEYNLQFLAQLFHPLAMEKIKQLSFWVYEPILERHFDRDAWWKGEGLDLVCVGNLQSLRMTIRDGAYPLYTISSVRDYLKRLWSTNEKKTNPPVVELLIRVTKVKHRREQDFD